jgi:3-dehydroquinate synthase class II
MGKITILANRLAESILMDWDKEEVIKLAKEVAVACHENIEFISLVQRMRDARHKYSALSREFCSKGMKPRQSQEWQDARKLTKQLESEVDEYLKMAIE